MAGTVRRRRGAAAVPVLVVLLVLVPIVETIVLIRVGHAIGALPTLLVLVAEAMLGAWLMRREGSRAWKALQATLVSGRMPATELTDAALVLVGGVLLMLPGFVTDIVGIIFLLPFTRPLARSVVAFFATRQVAKTGLDVEMMKARTRPGSTIEGEVVADEAAPQRDTTRSPGRAGDGEPPAITGRVL